MFEKRIPIQEGTCLTLDEMAGDVTISGWDRDEVLIRLGDDGADRLQIEPTDDGPVLSAQASCEIQMPASSPIAVRQVSANLAIKGVHATLNTEQVRGNLVLRDIGPATLAEVYGNLKTDAVSSLRLVGTVYGDVVAREIPSIDLQNVRGNLRAKDAGSLRVSRVGGNLQAKGIAGNLDADNVGGNAMLQDVGGMTTLDSVAGNLLAKNLTGGAKAARIGGNLVFNGELGAGRSYHFRADGNATLRLSEEAGAHLALTAKGNLLTSVVLSEQQRDGKTLTGTLGDGGSEVVVEAKGNIMISGGGAALGAELGAEISRQVEESLRVIDLEAIGRQVSEEMEEALSRLRVKLENVNWERLGLQTQQAINRAMDRMQHDMDRMVEKAAHHQERLERRAEREARRMERMEQKLQQAGQRSQEPEYEARGQGKATQEAHEPPEPEPDLDEERLSILRMVEQGQISPEEAEMLLDALK
jgi:hypothetical protein